MLFPIVKAALSGLLVLLISEFAKRNPAAGALIASLPFVSILAMIWLWGETQDSERIASHSEATFWYVLPSLPMFLILPWMLRQGIGFWVALASVCVLTSLFYFVTVLIAAKFGIKL